MVSYWLARGGQKFGPYSVEDLQRMAAGGTAFATDLLWGEGMPAWAPFTQIVPLAVTPAAPPPPPPVPAGVALVPPSEHWALILALGCVTGGIVPWVWLFKQSNFARRLDPRNRSTLFLGLALIVLVAWVVACFGSVNAEDQDAKALFGLLILFLWLLEGILFLVGVYQVRRAMLNYYNQVEPINLRLSGVMTFFFNILYFQHHCRRIAMWKQTGFLEPQ